MDTNFVSDINNELVSCVEKYFGSEIM